MSCSQVTSTDLVPLTQHCRELGRRVTIETAGTVDLSVRCQLMAISPKLSNSVPPDFAWHDRHEQAQLSSGCDSVAVVPLQLHSEVCD